MKTRKMGKPTGEPISVLFECSKCGCVYEAQIDEVERLEHWKNGVSYICGCPMCKKSNSRTREEVETKFGLFEFHLSNTEVPFAKDGSRESVVRFQDGKWG